jgi:protease-4
VHELARGRVWTGADAIANGLADEAGGLREAVAIAR